MRVAGLIVVVVLGLGVAHAARAQEPPAAAASTDAARKSAKQDWGDGRSVTDPRDRPAQGAPYNWRQMAFGLAIMAAMLAFVVWLIRRQTRTR